MLKRPRAAAWFLMFLASAGPAIAADDASILGSESERSVFVINEYRPTEGTVLIGNEAYRLSPEAAGSLAAQLQNRSDRSKPFGAAVVFGRDALGRPQINAIRVVP
jgi:hypothetical protein